MEQPIPVLLPAREARIVARCEDHLRCEETLLAELLLSLRQVREAFFRRNLNILLTLQSRQDQLAQTASELAAARDHLRIQLADLLGLAPAAATLRAAAEALSEPARGRLLRRHARLIELVREADQLSQQNAALLGYARGFFASLLAGLTGTSISERYGPKGERRGGMYGSFLEARV